MCAAGDNMQRAAGGSTGSLWGGKGWRQARSCSRHTLWPLPSCPLTCRWVLAATQPPGHRKSVLGKGRSFKELKVQPGQLCRPTTPSTEAFARQQGLGFLRLFQKPGDLLIHPTPSEWPRVPRSRFSFSHKILHTWSLILSVKQKDTEARTQTEI